MSDVDIPSGCPPEYSLKPGESFSRNRTSNKPTRVAGVSGIILHYRVTHSKLTLPIFPAAASSSDSAPFEMRPNQ